MSLTRTVRHPSGGAEQSGGRCLKTTAKNCGAEVLYIERIKQLGNDDATSQSANRDSTHSVKNLETNISSHAC